MTVLAIIGAVVLFFALVLAMLWTAGLLKVEAHVEPDDHKAKP